MKKVIISLLVALLCCTVANAESIDSIQAIEKAKAIVAYEMNMLSFKDVKSTEEKNKQLKQLESVKDAGTIEKIKEVIDKDKYKANLDLCDDINGIHYSENEGKLSVYFSRTIFEKSPLKEFISKKKGEDIKNGKYNIQKRIEDLEKTIGKSDKPIENQPPIAFSPEVESDANSGCIPNSFKDQTSVMLGLLIFATVGYVLSAYLFFKGRKKTARIMGLKDKLRTAKDQNERFNKNQIELTIRLEKAEDKQKELLSIKRELTEELDQRKMVEAREEEAKAKIRAEAAKWPKTIFLATPSKEGLFSEEFSEYKKGRALYRLTTDDGKTGRFEFIDEGEARFNALNSVSSFLKPACDIDEAVSARDTVNIITISHGIAKKTDNGWEVSTKAKIQFS